MWYGVRSAYCVLYPPPCSTTTSTTWLEFCKRVSLWSGAVEKKRGEREEKDYYMQNAALPSGANRNIHGTACFKFVDLATIWFSLFAFLFLAVFFTLCEFAQENAVISALAPNKTLIFITTLKMHRRNLSCTFCCACLLFLYFWLTMREKGANVERAFFLTYNTMMTVKLQRVTQVLFKYVCTQMLNSDTYVYTHI